MNLAVLKLKLFRNDVQNVYIEIQQIGQNNPTHYEMNPIYNNEDMMLFTYLVILESEKLYRYRYILKSQNDFLKEENFRRFKKDENEDDDEENLVDEWNKVWNSIQVVFDQKEFFAECEKFQIFKILRPNPNQNSENNVFHLKYLTDDYKFYEEQQTLTFTNDQNEKEFQIYKNQEIHLNCVNTKITFGQLGNQLVKLLDPSFQFLLEQVEKKLEQKDDSIKQLIEEKTQYESQLKEQSKQKQSLQEELEQLKTYSIDQINKLQIDLEKQKEIASSYKQLKVQRINFDKNTIVEKSQTSDELIELLQKYQNSLDEIEQLRNQENDQLENKEREYEFLKKKNEKFEKIILARGNQLKEVDKKLNQYEDELRNRKEQKEKNQQTITILRQQIKRELQNHQDFSNKICKKSEQELLNTNQDLKIKLDQLEKDKNDQVETNKNLQKKFDQMNNENKKLEKEKKDRAKIIEELTDKQSKSNIYFYIRFFLIFVAVFLLGVLFLENFNMKEELKMKNSMIEESKQQKYLDDKNLKNQINQNNAQKAAIDKNNQDFQLKLTQMEKEKKKLEQENKEQAETNQNIRMKLTQMEKENKELAETIKDLKKQWCLGFQFSGK